MDFWLVTPMLMPVQKKNLNQVLPLDLVAIMNKYNIQPHDYIEKLFEEQAQFTAPMDIDW